LAGGVPNWGRILAAAGSSGVPIDAGRLRLMVQARASAGGPDGDWVVLADGGTDVGADPERARAAFGAPEVALRLELGMGGAEAVIWTCDMTAAYVELNARDERQK
jgi:glutamate N-acetyltransferase/amino-acid N-acetyltransferase